jgi:hypothetical protein
MPPVHARTFLRRAGLWRPRRRWRARLPGAGVPVCAHPHPRASGGFLRAPAPARRKGETAQPSRGPISLCNNVAATLSCTLSPQCRLLPCATPPTRWFPPVVGQSTLRHHPAPVSGAAPVAGAAPEPRVVSAPRVSCVVIGGGSGAAGSGITGHTGPPATATCAGTHDAAVLTGTDDTFRGGAATRRGPGRLTGSPGRHGFDTWRARRSRDIWPHNAIGDQDPARRKWCHAYTALLVNHGELRANSG